MPSTPTRSNEPKRHSQACNSANPAVVVGNDSTPSTPPLASSAAATWTSKWVSTPPVIGRVLRWSSPSLLCSSGQGVARTSREGDRDDRTALTDRTITLRNGACPYPPTVPTDRHHHCRCSNQSDRAAGAAERSPAAPAAETRSTPHRHSHWHGGVDRPDERYPTAHSVSRTPGPKGRSRSCVG